MVDASKIVLPVSYDPIKELRKKLEKFKRVRNVNKDDRFKFEVQRPRECLPLFSDISDS